MNTNPDPSDRLIDSLLREQAGRRVDDAFLESVEAKLDELPQPHPRRKPLLAIASLAAAVVFLAGLALWMRPSDSGDTLLAVARDEALEAQTAPLPRTPHPEPLPASVSVEARNAEASTRPIDRPAVLPPLPQEFASIPDADASAGHDRIAKLEAVPAARGALVGRTRQRIVPPPGEPAATDAFAGFVFPNEEAQAGEPLDRETYGRLEDQPWQSPWREPLSTFSIDVDTASYTNLRRLISEDMPIQKDAVRIEECINYFDYNYEGPRGEGPFAASGLVATCPWQPRHLLARVAVQGREVEAIDRPASNLVFLIDVSGSMRDPKKLPLLKQSMRILIGELDERDRVGMVVYAGSEGVVLPPTTLDSRGRVQALAALEKLEAGGSTNGGAGLRRAYRMAAEHRVPGGVNRVILASDGDFNVGTTGQGELVELVKEAAKGGISLSVLGFGRGNLNDAALEAITNEGNGNYFYIDGEREARRVFLQKLTGTLVTIAKDVKIQVEFNPGKVRAYRLIGYANRMLRDEDFANDKVDAGDIGAGHSVTAFYEIVPAGVEPPDLGEVDALRYQQPEGTEAVPSDDWFTLKLRHKHPEGDRSELTEMAVTGEPLAWEEAGGDFRFAAAVALFGMKLRDYPEVADIPWDRVVEMAAPAVTDEATSERAGFLDLVRKLGRR